MHDAHNDSARRSLHIVLLDFRDITHPEAGGAEMYLNQIFQRIAARGHRVTLLCSRAPGSPKRDRIGHIEVRRVAPQSIINFAAARAARRLEKEERVDLFVENLCKVPFLLPLFTGTPVLAIVHHLFGGTAFHHLNPAVAALVCAFERLIPPIYRGLPFVTVSRSTMEDLIRRGVRFGSVEIVHNGVDRAVFSGNGISSSHEPLLVYVSRIKRYKQIDVTLHAFAKVLRAVPAARYVLVGKGDDQPRLERLVRHLGLQGSVQFTGFVPEEEKLSWLRRARALLYPSTREGWGIGAVEAAACGTPVIASNVDGLRDAVRDGETGFLVPHADVGHWASRMVQLLTDDSLRARMSESALAWARRFDWDMEAERMHAIVCRVAAGQTA